MYNSFKKQGIPYSISVLKNSLRFFEQFIFPSKCLKCGTYIDGEPADLKVLESCFCDPCMTAGLYPLDRPFCTKCSRKFYNSVKDNHVCGDCLKTPLKTDRVRAAVEYKGVIKDVIPLFKYHSKLSVAKLLEHLLFEAFLNHYAGSRIDVIIPMPLHKKKLRERGFNQAFFLIRNFSKLYRQRFEQSPPWEIDIESLARIKKTQSQTGFNIEERKRNLKDAFTVIRKQKIKNKSILLIDDVFTTGATCNEAAGALLKQGAKNVNALVLARA